MTRHQGATSKVVFFPHSLLIMALIIPRCLFILVKNGWGYTPIQMPKI